MKNRAPLILDQETAKATVLIMQHPRPPMIRRGQRDFEPTHLHGLPTLQLLNPVEPQPLHETSNMLGHDDRLIRRHGTERFFIEVIEMGVRDQHKIGRGKIIEGDTRFAQAFDDFEPARPVGID